MAFVPYCKTSAFSRFHATGVDPSNFDASALCAAFELRYQRFSASSGVASPEEGQAEGRVLPHHYHSTNKVCFCLLNLLLKVLSECLSPPSLAGVSPHVVKIAATLPQKNPAFFLSPPLRDGVWYRTPAAVFSEL